jgi:hypothetical protein
MQNSSISDKLVYPTHILAQCIIWGLIIHIINYHNLTFQQTVFYLLTGELLTIGFIMIAIIPNILMIMSLREDRDENKEIFSNMV